MLDADKVLITTGTFEETIDQVLPALRTVLEHLGLSATLQAQTFTRATTLFPDGEVCVSLPHEVQTHEGPKDVFHVFANDGIDSVNSALVEILALCDALAGPVRLICPFLPYTRQDAPDSTHGRPATTGAIARLLRSVGVDEIVTLPSGNTRRVTQQYDPIQLTYVPWVEALVHGLKSSKFDIVVGPDEGSEPLVRAVSTRLGAVPVIGEKSRTSPTDVDVTVAGLKHSPKSILIVDDLISSGETIARTVAELEPRAPVVIAAIHLRPIDRTNQRLRSLNDSGHVHDIIALTNLQASHSISSCARFITSSSVEESYLESLSAQKGG